MCLSKDELTLAFIDGQWPSDIIQYFQTAKFKLWSPFGTIKVHPCIEWFERAKFSGIYVVGFLNLTILYKSEEWNSAVGYTQKDHRGTQSTVYSRLRKDSKNQKLNFD